jgi:K+-transporting ATPase A subunit
MNQNLLEFYLYRTENNNRRHLDLLKTKMMAKIMEISQKVEQKSGYHSYLITILISMNVVIAVVIICIIYHNYTKPLPPSGPMQRIQPSLQPTPYYSNYTRNRYE